MAVNDKLLDRAISHKLYLIRYQTSVVNDVLKVLQAADRDLSKRIKLKNNERLKDMRNAIRDIINETNDQVEGTLRDNLQELAEYEASHELEVLNEEVPIKLDLVTPSPEQVYSAAVSRPFQNELLKEMVSGWKAKRRRRIEGAIRQGFVEGQTPGQIARRVVGDIATGRGGVTKADRRAAAAITRTAVNHVSTVAREQVYKENADIIKGVQWVSTLDNRTTLICASRDGKVWPGTEGPRPPAHYNCRSTTAPVTKSWRELGIDMDEIPEGTRASMDGQVPAKTTYPEWLKRQSEETQREVLGGRYEDWKAGRFNLDRFADDGQSMTLSQLREMNL